MKKISLLSIVALPFLTYSCENNKPEYPKYELSSTIAVPDSLKPQYREWVKETVRAASQQMTGGDYEDADETIKQAEETGLNIFGKAQPCLQVFVAQYNYYKVNLSEMNEKEKQIFDSLYNSK